LAELDGANNASEIQKALHPLRVRVNMPDVDFDREYNTDADYPFHNLDKYIQAMRVTILFSATTILSAVFQPIK